LRTQGLRPIGAPPYAGPIGAPPYAGPELNSEELLKTYESSVLKWGIVRIYS